jgi:hypothetical protein
MEYRWTRTDKTQVNLPDVIDYDPTEFDFSAMVVEKFRAAQEPNAQRLELAFLHYFDRKASLIRTRERDQCSPFHQGFYALARTLEFQAMYIDFIESNVVPLIAPGLVYQAIPTFRVMYPGNLSVGEFHRDRDYGHPPCEINIVVPLSDMLGSAGIVAEIRAGSEQYQIHEARRGQFLLFDGANLRHGNYPNGTEKTRVSFDFRCITPVDWKRLCESGRRVGKSINTGTRFDLSENGYYRRLG